MVKMEKEILARLRHPQVLNLQLDSWLTFILHFKIKNICIQSKNFAEVVTSRISLIESENLKKNKLDSLLLHQSLFSHIFIQTKSCTEMFVLQIFFLTTKDISDCQTFFLLDLFLMTMLKTQQGILSIWVLKSFSDKFMILLVTTTHQE